jgi:hypothetical protein
MQNSQNSVLNSLELRDNILGRICEDLLALIPIENLMTSDFSVCVCTMCNKIL